MFSSLDYMTRGWEDTTRWTNEFYTAPMSNISMQSAPIYTAQIESPSTNPASDTRERPASNLISYLQNNSFPTDSDSNTSNSFTRTQPTPPWRPFLKPDSFLRKHLSRPISKPLLHKPWKTPGGCLECIRQQSSSVQSSSRTPHGSDRTTSQPVKSSGTSGSTTQFSIPYNVDSGKDTTDLALCPLADLVDEMVDRCEILIHHSVSLANTWEAADRVLQEAAKTGDRARVRRERALRYQSTVKQMRLSNARLALRSRQLCIYASH